MALDHCADCASLRDTDEMYWVYPPRRNRPPRPLPLWLCVSCWDRRCAPLAKLSR